MPTAEGRVVFLKALLYGTVKNSNFASASEESRLQKRLLTRAPRSDVHVAFGSMDYREFRCCYVSLAPPLPDGRGSEGDGLESQGFAWIVVYPGEREKTYYSFDDGV